MHSKFYKKLLQKTILSLPNDYKDNYDQLRFGKVPAKKLKDRIYNSKIVTDRFINKSNFISILNNYHATLNSENFDKLELLYELLENEESKELMIELIAYRMLGHKKVKLSVNNPGYHENLKKCIGLQQEALNADLGEFKLHLFNLQELGYDIKLYLALFGILSVFALEQYCYKTANKVLGVQPGDTVIDAGGCWGDTALYFAAKSGNTGKVFSFEFIPKNLAVFKKNLALNPHMASRIEIIENPVWDENNILTYYTNKGPSSMVSFKKMEGNEHNTAKTKTIDSLVEEKKLNNVDFIKMDIEGAEPYALKGAEQTIRKYKPRLAIAIYHSMDDFVNIAGYIHSLNLGYKLYLGHYTIHSEETILFAATE